MRIFGIINTYIYIFIFIYIYNKFSNELLSPNKDKDLSFTKNCVNVSTFLVGSPKALITLPKASRPTLMLIPSYGC